MVRRRVRKGGRGRGRCPTLAVRARREEIVDSSLDVARKCRPPFAASTDSVAWTVASFATRVSDRPQPSSSSTRRVCLVDKRPQTRSTYVHVARIRIQSTVRRMSPTSSSGASARIPSPLVASSRRAPSVDVVASPRVSWTAATTSRSWRSRIVRWPTTRSVSVDCSGTFGARVCSTWTRRQRICKEVRENDVRDGQEGRDAMMG